MIDQNLFNWLNGSKIGCDIVTNKYLQPNETFNGWLYRVSGGNPKYRNLILQKKFLPAGRILSNRGLFRDGIKVTYSNCYVQTPPEDNIESIFECAKGLARTFSYGGGVGIDISKLAPRGAKVNNTAKATSGSVSFMDLYSLVTELIGQNGRRGALMISIDCNHPDLEEFIDVKNDLNKVTKANISVKITDEFMKAVEDDEEYVLSYTREETGEEIKKVVQAKKVFRKLCEANWNMAEPGMLFWDNVQSWNLLSNNPDFKYAGTNPCAEEPLPAGGSCLLGSINLAEFVDCPFEKDAKINENELRETVRDAIRFLDEILMEGLPLHPLEEQQRTVNDWRQIGLGIMGLSDMLIKLGVTYGSTQAIQICDVLGGIIADEAIKTSSIIASEKGSYPKYNPNVVNTGFFEVNASSDTAEIVKMHGLAHSQLLTIAPTGTLSTMLGVSGGLEPIFANSYTRKTESLKGKDEYYKVYTPIVKEYMEKYGIENEEDLPEYFVTAEDIAPINRIKMQAAFQEHIDASISSTINLPNSAAVEDIENLYMEAWKYGLKGITIYRAGCKRDGILVADNKQDNAEENMQNDMQIEKDKVQEDLLPRGYIIGVNDDLIGMKRKLTTGCGTLHFEMYVDEFTGEPQETFINIGSSGGCERNYQFISRLMSLALRAGVPIEAIIDQAKSIKVCSAYRDRMKLKGDTSRGTSCPSAIGYALEELYQKTKDRYFMEEETDSDNEEGIDVYCSGSCGECEEKCHEEGVVNTAAEPKCPECGNALIFEGGCNICKSCGWSKCD